MKAPCPERRPARPVAELHKGGGILEAFGDRHRFADCSALPGALPRTAQHDLFGIMAALRIEKNPLDRRKAVAISHRDQQRRLELRARDRTLRASWVKSKVGKRSFEPPKPQVNLSKCASNADCIVPNALDIARSRLVGFHRNCETVRRIDLPELTQHVRSRAAGIAMHEDAAVALSER